MKNRKCLYILNILLLMSLFAALLSGCQLAKDTSSVNSVTGSAKDQLCGVFVTFGYQELPVNQDALLDVDLKTDSNGKLIMDEQELFSTSGNKVEGILSDDKSTLKFEGITGYYMGAVHQDLNGEDSVVYMGDKGLHESKYAVNKTDDEELRSSEATISVSTKFHEAVNVSPVYIRGDGTYYTLLHQNPGMSFSGSTVGSCYSQSLDNTYTTTIDGKTTTEKESFKVNITVVDETKQIFIKEMNQNDELIKTTEYHKEDPDEFIVGDDTAYVIVEEVLDNDIKGTYTKRSVYSLDKKDMIDNAVMHTCSYTDSNNVVGVKIITFRYK